VALILAIEPSRNQSQQIAQMVKQNLKGVELITAGSAEAALIALGDRIPELILTPALLSSKDESALTERLRQLGSAAAHIHTLAVPIIESSKPRSREQGGGLLGRRRDKPDAPASVGCDPAVFAEQIKVYLERAAREREMTMETSDTESAFMGASAGAPENASSGQDVDATITETFDDLEIDWLSEDPVNPEPPATTPVEPAQVPDPMVTSSIHADDVSMSAAGIESASGSEKRRSHPQTQATRAFEAEFGLPSAASTSPPLWRVTEEGIESMSAEVPVIVDERVAPPPIETSSMAAEQAPLVRATAKQQKPVKPKKPQTPTIDDWAYFDPQQAAFKALLKRLDEVAGYAR
jgi:hypothetical protein